MSKLIFRCLLVAIPHISLCPLQYFCTSYNFFKIRAWPSYVLNQNPHVLYGWEKAHWQTAVVGHSTLETELHCPGESCLQRRWIAWWTDRGGGLGVCFSSVLKSPSVSGPGGAKFSFSPLEEWLCKVTYLPWAFMYETVCTLSFFFPLCVFLPCCLPLFSPLWLNGLPRRLYRQVLCSKSRVCVLTNPQDN